MTFILLNAIGQALERVPANGHWMWTNAIRWGTPLRIQDALLVAEDVFAEGTWHHLRIVPDYHQRPPESL